jgi:hypothetical protein
LAARKKIHDASGAEVEVERSWRSDVGSMIEHERKERVRYYEATGQ